MKNWAKGCKLCKKGAKLVLFVSGTCDAGCYYCPLSENRRKDKPYANERPIPNDSDLFLEADRMDARGASITGGEPLLSMEKTTHYIKILKQQYNNFHIHLYTYGTHINTSNLNDLESAGLDELRLHSGFQNLGLARKYSFDLGVEIPIIPGENQLSNYEVLFKQLENKIDFLNLNELEFSPTNTQELLNRGFENKNDTSHAALGSEQLAKKLIPIADQYNLNPHYCSSQFKDATQFRNRLIRTANNIHKPYEKVTRDGLLLKGAITPPRNTKLPAFRKKLLRQFSLSPSYLEIDPEKRRLETSERIARRIAKNSKYKVAIIQEFPTSDRYEPEVEPI